MSLKKEVAASRTNKMAAMGLGSSMDHRSTKPAKVPAFEKKSSREQTRSGDQENYTCAGASAKARLDRSAYARGGKVGKGKTTVNVIIAPQGQGGAGAGAGGPPMPPPGAGAAPPPMPPRPPMMPPGGAPMMPPGGAPPMPPPGGMPRKRGGRVIKDGAGSGPGRLEKITAYGKKSKVK